MVAGRLLAEGGLIYLEDLDPEAARELLRAAWREAARERFAGLDISGLDAEIDAMVDSLVMVTSAPDGVRLHARVRRRAGPVHRTAESDQF